MLKIQLHCNCIKRHISEIKGVKDVEFDAAKDLVKVTGTMDVAALLAYLREKLSRDVEVVAPSKKDDGGNKPKEVCALFFSWNRALVLPLGWLLYPGRRVRRRRIPLLIGSLCSSTALFSLPGVPGALLGSCCVAFGKAVKLARRVWSAIANILWLSYVWCQLLHLAKRCRWWWYAIYGFFRGKIELQQMCYMIL